MDPNQLDVPGTTLPASPPSDSSENEENYLTDPIRAESPLYRSQAAFLRDLPELLKTHPDKWVAYADGQRLRIGNSQDEMYRLCLLDLHLPHERFVVRLIEPWGSQQIEL